MGAEAAAYSLVNLVATGVAVVIFNLLAYGIKGLFEGILHAEVTWAYVIAHSIGMVVSYLGTRHFAFRHRHVRGPAGGFPLYAAITLASFAIPVSCLWFTRNVLEIATIYTDNLAGNVVGSLLASVARFWAFRKFVFRRTIGGQPAQHIAPSTLWGPPEVVPDESEFGEHHAK